MVCLSFLWVLERVVMIVFLSDLHIEDESVGKHNVSADAFPIFFEHLQRLGKRRSVKELRIVLLGDTIDLLRTSYWFDVDQEHRPWGWKQDSLAPLAMHTKIVLDKIIDKNRNTFESIRQGVASLRKSIPTNVTFVVGNHDRLANISPVVRRRIRDVLGETPIDDPFEERFVCQRHGVVALHGHQFDVYNHESVSDANRWGVPIGDPITTELVARIPACVLKEIERQSIVLSDEETEQIQKALERIEDVRPVFAVVDWLLSFVRHAPALEQAMYRGLDEALRMFRDLPFVRWWLDSHDTWTKWDDAADRLQWVMWIAGHVSLQTASRLGPAVERMLTALQTADPYVIAAQQLSRQSGAPFVVMGHTHAPKQQALGLQPSQAASPVRRVYLNTGTWRPCHHRCADKSGFIVWKQMSYVIVYSPEERNSEGMPSFETWTDTLDSGESSHFAHH